MVLGVAFVGGVLVDKITRQALVADFFSPATLQLVLVLDLVVLAYRVAAAVDAYRLAVRLNAGSGSSARWLIARPLSVAGLLGVVLVLSLGHVALARYDRIAYDTISAITSDDSGPGGSANGSAGPVTPTAPIGSTSPSSTSTAGPSVATAPPATVPWNGTGRLNVLLVGTDQRPGTGSFNTDTMIVASIDPTTGEVAMFSIPRDTTEVPLPGAWAASSYFGGAYPNRINSLWSYARANPKLFNTDPAHAYTALEGALGDLLGISIPYYLEVNFDGFVQVVNTLGGAMIDVQLPVADYHYPIPDTTGGLKLYIPPGIQFMTGAQALAYARARHQTNDFDRAARQQRVIVSLRAQTDLLSLLNPAKLEALSVALRSAIHTNFPADKLPALISLLEGADLNNLRSYVFTPPVYETQCPPASCSLMYWLHPKIGVIRQTVRQAFTVNPALERSRQALESENAQVWVVSGSPAGGQPAPISGYLDYLGINALVPPVNGGRADRLTYPNSVVTFYNGAEATMPETVRVLETTFGVQIATRTDPNVHVDVIVITGAATPNLRAPVQ